MNDASIEVWRGAVDSGDCDIMGHMNIRVYVALSVEGLAGLAAALGMPDAFQAGAETTLGVREQHIRFLREAHAGTPLYMTAGLEAFEPDGSAVVLQRLVHSRSGDTAATFRTVISPASPADDSPKAWPQAACERAGALMVETPPEAQERGVSPRPEAWAAGLEAADRMGLKLGARGAVSPADCDVFGRMKREIVMKRITDAMPYLDAPFREAASMGEDAPGKIGGASIEFRLAYFDMPEAGSLLSLRSGLAKSGPKVQNMVHWLLDPVSGRAYASAEMVMISFNLEARKMIAIGPEGQAALQALVAPGLTM